MRILEFNVWDPREKKMYKHERLFDSTISAILYNAREKDIQDLIFLQYTSKKDEKGRKIFEGDVAEMLRPEGFRGIGEVVGITLSGFKVKEKVYVNNKLEFTDIVGVSNVKKVIGNIFENPKLIKKE